MQSLHITLMMSKNKTRLDVKEVDSKNLTQHNNTLLPKTIDDWWS